MNEKNENIEAILAKQEEFLKQHGWYTHFVFGDINNKTINVHTHGLENFQHENFQIVLNLPQAVCQNILKNFVDRVKDGEKFKSDDVVENIIKSPYKVRLTTAVESGRNVLRIILPDKDGNLSQETQEPPYDMQWL